MGAFMQPQGQLQVAVNMIDFGMNPQQALETPKWQWLKEDTILVESRFDEAMAEELRKMGHHVVYEPWTPLFGKGQIILRLDSGVLVGATESRYDSNISCY